MMTRTREEADVNSPRSLCLVVLLLCFVGCGDDDDENPMEPEFVTISGIVRNIDDASIAVGVGVSLLGTEYRDDVATGTDGRYSLRIPKGATLQLHTDDFDLSKADEWFPMINADLPAIVANEDMLDWPIHTCPQPGFNNAWSVETWNEYLADYDSANGDLSEAPSAAAASGVLVILCIDCDTDADLWPGIVGLKITSGDPAFPIAYVNAGGLGPPNFVHPASVMATDGSGFAISWGDPDFTGESVDLSFMDTMLERDYRFMSPFSCPVRPGTVTLLWPTVVDGVPNKTFRDCACGIELFPCDER
jgi:hypothetical protein